MAPSGGHASGLECACFMADIFLSYSRKDETAAAALAAELAKCGWSVWWDPQIAPGRDYA